MAFDGWRAGAAGEEFSIDGDELRVAVVLGITWPLWAMAVLVFLAAYGAAALAHPR